MSMIGWCRILSLVVFCSAACVAQEAAFVDLTEPAPRVALRRPARQPDDPPAQGGSITTRECAIPDPNAGSLKTTIVVLDRVELRVGDEPLFQVQIENVGSAAVKVPISAAMEPLQPDDLSQKFAYYEADVALWIGGASWYANTAGSLTLYGDDSHPGTIVMLRPGEWVRVAGKGKIRLLDDSKLRAASGDKPNRLFARTAIYHVETNVTSTATATTSQGTCIKQIEGPSRSIQFSEK
jgi:hypothetical protein